METNNEMTTKVCVKCGRELPVSSFNKHSHAKDGLQPYCRECSKAATMKTYYARKNGETKSSRAVFVPSSAKRVWYKEELAGISNKDLIEELKARGFRGKLEYIYTVDM